VEALVRGEAKPYEVATALMHELGRRASTVLVLEDVHWADEATLDVIRLLGRKVEGVPALVLVSYRDELDRVHPLRVLAGELSTSQAVRRLRVDPLSPDAVARLAAPHGVDAEVLYRRTGGNPFFVTEVLAAGGEEIPVTAVVFNNGQWGAEKKNQIDYYADRFVGTNLKNPSFAGIAKAMGAEGITVSHPGEVGDGELPAQNLDNHTSSHTTRNAAKKGSTTRA